MKITDLLMQGVRPFAAANYLGAPTVVYHPDDGTGDAPTELSLDEAAKAYAATQSDALADEDEQADDEVPADGAEAEDGPDDEEDAEGEPGDDDQADDEQDEPDSGQGRFVADNAKVRLEDGTVISVSELKKGSLLNGDYTRKTQELAEQRRSVESQSAQFQSQMQQLSEERAYALNLVQSLLPQPPDPNLINTSPVQYMAQKAAYENMQAHVAYLQGQQQQSAQDSQARSQQEERQLFERETAALREAIPAFKDDARLKAFGDDIVKHGQAYGFTPQELRAVGLDHRQALVLRDAIAWRKLQASKSAVPQKVEGRPPVQKGSKRFTPDAQRARAKETAIGRLKQSGSVADAAAAYLASQKG